MQMVKPVSNRSWLIFDKIFWLPGTADSLMQKTPQERMDVIANYLADHIKVKNIFLKKTFLKTLKKLRCTSFNELNAKYFRV